MNKSRLPTSVLLTLCLCLGSLAFCELVDPLTIWENYQQMSEQGGVPHHSHTHDNEHDDDFALTGQAAVYTQVVSILKKRSTYLLGDSTSPSPLLPPPKTA